ncbi:MAG: hypothetical protein HY516_01280 [Candidatus Aenigmarchaeota archaeon]|nr:hypothetical protein [Candidatus Aenigmarchaeota archaeon]
MGVAYSSPGQKSGKNYVTVEEKESVRVDNLMSARAAGYKITAGYKKPKAAKSAYGKKQKRIFVPTQCKFCGAEVSYGSVSKSRLRAAGSTWIDTCESCSVNPDVAQSAKIYV